MPKNKCLQIVFCECVINLPHGEWNMKLFALKAGGPNSRICFVIIWTDFSYIFVQLMQCKSKQRKQSRRGQCLCNVYSDHAHIVQGQVLLPASHCVYIRGTGHQSEPLSCWPIHTEWQLEAHNVWRDPTCAMGSGPPTWNLEPKWFSWSV